MWAGALRRVWRALPLPPSTRLKAHLTVNWVRLRLHAAVRPHHKAQIARPEVTRVWPGEVILSAYLSDINGIGRAGRLTHQALKAWPTRVLAHDIRLDSRGSDVAAKAGEGGIWLCHCNPPEVFQFMATGDERLWRNRYRIGYWAYELQTLPSSWVPAIALFHEVWAPSQFVADSILSALGDVTTVIRVVPHPLPKLHGIAGDRGTFGTLNRFTFLAMFDTRSSAARKNPFGAVQAFQSAFSAEDQAALLIVKVVFADDDRHTMSKLRHITSQWSNIRIITEHMSDNQTLELIASVDCLVSLHRSEGFGLTISEAMSLGTAVIATNWSAPAEFSQGAAVLVPYRLVPAVDESGRYDVAGQVWADPDLEFAAKAMRRLRRNRRERETLAEAARARVVERFGRPILPDRYERFLRRNLQQAAAE